MIRAAQHQMTACQVFTKSERQWAAKPLEPDAIQRYLDRRDEAGVAMVVAHDSYLINIASPDDALWEKSRAALREELDRCDALEVPYLVSHPGAHVGSGTDAGIRRVAEALNRIHYERPNGKATLLIETTAGQGSCLGASFEEIAEILAGVDDAARIGVCLDTCHVFAAGYDIRDSESYADTMRSFDRIVGIDKLRCLHLNDSQKPLGSRIDRHAHIGEGEIGLGAFELLLNDRRLSGLPGVIETPKGDDGAEDGVNLGKLRALTR
jgi:deoxyribonuclease-4